MTDFRVHTYTAAEPGIYVNGYVLETAEGLILVDSSLLVSDARALAARITALRKPLLAAFVTHPHPDHYNALPYITGEDVPVYATAAVATTIADTAVAKRNQWGPTYGDEWPDRYRVPSHSLADGDTVSVGGLDITVHDMGPAESDADSYFVVGDRQAAFVGDLAFDGFHSYTSDGHSGLWLEALDRLTDLLDGVPLYPGHGAVGDTKLFARQRQYLLMYREAVRRLGEDKEALTELMSQYLPGAPLGWLVGLGADAVAAELSA